MILYHGTCDCECEVGENKREENDQTEQLEGQFRRPDSLSGRRHKPSRVRTRRSAHAEGEDYQDQVHKRSEPFLANSRCAVFLSSAFSSYFIGIGEKTTFSERVWVNQ